MKGMRLEKLRGQESDAVRLIKVSDRHIRLGRCTVWRCSKLEGRVQDSSDVYTFLQQRESGEDNLVQHAGLKLIIMDHLTDESEREQSQQLRIQRDTDSTELSFILHLRAISVLWNKCAFCPLIHFVQRLHFFSRELKMKDIRVFSDPRRVVAFRERNEPVLNGPS
jgi:hypothetical protein